MAYKIIRTKTNEEQPGVEIEAILDAESDLAALGTDYAPGSVAMVADTGSAVFVINASGQWKKI